MDETLCASAREEVTPFGCRRYLTLSSIKVCPLEIQNYAVSAFEVSPSDRCKADVNVDGFDQGVFIVGALRIFSSRLENGLGPSPIDGTS